MTLMAERILPDPPIDPESAPFFMAARDGRFVIKRCGHCGNAHWYPRAVCPICFSGDTRWEDASGRATVYAFSPMRRVDPPYTLAYVTLAEGPTMLTNLIDGDIDGWRIGQPVQVRFVDSADGTPVPCFAPA